jgi:hypothetical protein
MASPAAEGRIARALVGLLSRLNDDAFVIIEEPRSGKFVQFGRGPVLRLDLPCAALTPDEAERASELFDGLGVEGPTEYDAPDPTAGRLRHGASFQVNFGEDIEAAARTAGLVLTRVFLLPSDAGLAITEH